MMSTRSAARLPLSQSRLALRVPGRQQIRFQSTSSASSSSSSGSAAANGSFGAGVVGGVAGAALFYGIYSFTPAGRTASKLNKTVKEAEKKYQEAAKKLQANTPSSSQAVESIKQFAYSYVGWIPGGRGYVDAAFKDWDTVREGHGEEADKIVNDAYKQFQEISKAGLSLEAASRAYEVLADVARKIANLTGDALSDVVDNHPQLKEKLGGNIDQLKQMGERYGPEAKKQVDETWRQVKDIFAGGFSASSLAKARELIDEKVQQVQKLGDEAWKKGLEEAKPYLEKSPKVKELLENNADALKKGNVTELFGKLRDAAKSGDAGDLESYIKQAAQKAKDKADESGWGSLGKYLDKVPQGSEILKRLEEMGRLAEEHKEEGEKLLKETIGDLQKVLEEKGQKARKIADSGKKD
ncbi:hypothetical protein TARUN_9272 [Trichoderma arundinaceum]|uniref:Apolipoprotein/apolipophorin n=1 Tax=Trichoderma arundinaceum TaxID=490622 RepID=A0A395NAF1_TRIAR|nr:hypothetical protein TARUN_9272 [Trichoderma arundinaceum]